MTLVRRLAVVPAALVLALGAAGPAGAGTAATAGPDRSVEDVIDREMPASGVPGLAYAVVADGQVTAVGARAVPSGQARATPPPRTRRSPTGSISKSFTALAVMQLVEAGRSTSTPRCRALSRRLRRTARRARSRSGSCSATRAASRRSRATPRYSDATGEPDELARRVDRARRA